ncbi:MAG: DciA family protein [Planctomycetota bacterium]
MVPVPNPKPPAKPRGAIPVADLLGPALRSLGMPSHALSQRVLAAWDQAVDPSWRSQLRPDRFVGGVLIVSVSSPSLCQELTLFHRDRLLDLLRAALPGVTLVGLRFLAAGRPGILGTKIPGERT